MGTCGALQLLSIDGETGNVGLLSFHVIEQKKLKQPSAFSRIKTVKHAERKIWRKQCQFLQSFISIKNFVPTNHSLLRFSQSPSPYLPTTSQ